MAFAAAALFIASLGVNYWGAQRELAAVRAERAAIRADVAPLLLARDSLNTLKTQVQSLEEVSRSTPVWTRSLVELTALLPENTYLTGFFASGDTVELEAAGAEAGPAIQALRQAGIFEEIRLQGLVERELEEGETVEERFTLWARLPAPDGEGGLP
jgi:Tfp pilus assembly protein PilN